MISIENLGYTYPGAATPVLRGLRMTIATGEVYGLLGPSGAGKSTTQRIALGLLRGFTGSVELFGRPIESFGRDLYRRIGVSFELPAVYMRLTARENLKLFAALYDGPTREPIEVLTQVDLADAADQRVDQFSKGMKMRLNLARALLNDPELLFLDEPTTGQDPARARTTRNLIKALKGEGRTVFLTTHNMVEAEEVCDWVGFLADGRILVTGTPADLRRSYGQRRLEVATRTEAGLAVQTFPMEGIGANRGFLELLEAGDIISIHTLEASLDDVFIAATSNAAAAR